MVTPLPPKRCSKLFSKVNLQSVRKITKCDARKPQKFFVCMCVYIYVCMYVTFLLPPYKGMEEQESCAKSAPLIVIFYFRILMSFWATIILSPLPPTIKWSPVDRFWYSGCQNYHIDYFSFSLFVCLTVMSLLPPHMGMEKTVPCSSDPQLVWHFKLFSSLIYYWIFI